MSHDPLSSDPETDSLQTNGQLACPQFLSKEAGPREKTHPWQQFFFGCPSRGGILSMVNMLLWLSFYALLQGVPMTRTLEKLWGLAFLVLSLPLLLPFHLSQGFRCGGPSESEIIVSTIVLGINAFAWGYGIAWLIRFARWNPSAYLLYGFCGIGLLYYYFRIAWR